jgi:hypothetical protein
MFDCLLPLEQIFNYGRRLPLQYTGDKTAMLNLCIAQEIILLGFVFTIRTSNRRYPSSPMKNSINQTVQNCTKITHTQSTLPPISSQKLDISLFPYFLLAIFFFHTKQQFFNNPLDFISSSSVKIY